MSDAKPMPIAKLRGIIGTVAHPKWSAGADHRLLSLRESARSCADTGDFADEHRLD